MSDETTKTPLSKRDFLKLFGTLVVALLFDAVNKAVAMEDEGKLSERALSFKKLTDQLTQADASHDPEKIETAEKNMVIWTTFNLISILAPNKGYKMSSRMMNHWLYGEGKEVDISDYLAQTVSASRERFEASVSGQIQRNWIDPELMSKIMESTDQGAVAKLVRDSFQKNEVQFVSDPFFPPLGKNATDDLWLAMGNSSYKLSYGILTDFLYDPQTKNSTLTFNDFRVDVSDRYDWIFNGEEPEYKSGPIEVSDFFKEGISLVKEWFGGNIFAEQAVSKIFGISMTSDSGDILSSLRTRLGRWDKYLDNPPLEIDAEKLEKAGVAKAFYIKGSLVTPSLKVTI